MAIRMIVLIGYPLLREGAREVGRDELASSERQRFIDDLVETMFDASGAGIASHQVYRPIRVAAI